MDEKACIELSSSTFSTIHSALHSACSGNDKALRSWMRKSMPVAASKNADRRASFSKVGIFLHYIHWKRRSAGCVSECVCRFGSWSIVHKYAGRPAGIVFCPHSANNRRCAPTNLVSFRDVICMSLFVRAAPRESPSRSRQTKAFWLIICARYALSDKW
jgi:hypothetical protein